MSLDSCREPPGLAQQLFTQHLARVLTCFASHVAHGLAWEGPSTLADRKQLALASTDNALTAVTNSKYQADYNGLLSLDAKVVRIPCLCVLAC